MKYLAIALGQNMEGTLGPRPAWFSTLALFPDVSLVEVAEQNEVDSLTSRLGDEMKIEINPPMLREGEALIIPSAGRTMMHLKVATTSDQIMSYLEYTASTL